MEVTTQAMTNAATTRLPMAAATDATVLPVLARPETPSPANDPATKAASHTIIRHTIET
jgi:chitodextrinase